MPVDQPSGQHPTTSAAVWARLDSMSLPDLSVEAYLTAVTELAGQLVPQAVGVSVTLLSGEGPHTPAYSEDSALDLDLVQYRLGDGPCLQAAEDGRPVRVDDARADDRWPGYLPAAVGRGSLSSLSVPLQVRSHPVGAVNLYATAADAFADPAVQQSATHLAGSVAAGLAALQALGQATAAADNL
jgi:GAF domain-containing protein